MELSDKITRAIVGGAVLTTLNVGCKDEVTPPEPTPVVPSREAEKPIPVTATAAQVDVQPPAAPSPMPEAPKPQKPVTPPPECAAGVAGYNSETLAKGGSYKTCTPASSGCTTSTFAAKLGKVVCGPWESGDACCAVMAVGGKPLVKETPPQPDPFSTRQRPHVPPPPGRLPSGGRPFVIHGEVRTGEVQAVQGWASPYAVSVEELPAEQRARFAAEWSRAGAEEHASIASFSQFMLDLVSLGAPPELILGTARAIEDEVRHARQCFGLATCFAGEPLGPGAIDTDGAVAARDEADILRAAIAEGCIGETIAAFTAEWAAPQAVNRDVAAVLRGIADDEGDHAALAWRFVSWMLATRPDLRAVAGDAFAHVFAEPAQTGPLPCSAGVAFGVRTPELDAALHSRALRAVVRPAALQLLSEFS